MNAWYNAFSLSWTELICMSYVKYWFYHIQMNLLHMHKCEYLSRPVWQMNMHSTCIHYMAVLFYSDIIFTIQIILLHPFVRKSLHKFTKEWRGFELLVFFVIMMYTVYSGSDLSMCTDFSRTTASVMCGENTTLPALSICSHNFLYNQMGMQARNSW